VYDHPAFAFKPLLSHAVYLLSDGFAHPRPYSLRPRFIDPVPPKQKVQIPLALPDVEAIASRTLLFSFQWGPVRFAVGRYPPIHSPGNYWANYVHRFYPSFGIHALHGAEPERHRFTGLSILKGVSSCGPIFGTLLSTRLFVNLIRTLQMTIAGCDCASRTCLRVIFTILEIQDYNPKSPGSFFASHRVSRIRVITTAPRSPRRGASGRAPDYVITNFHSPPLLCVPANLFSPKTLKAHCGGPTSPL